jgi:hypothetical protein
MLVNASHIYINNNGDSKGIFELSGNSNIRLGTYKTEQRAAEVMDEIQRHLQNGHSGNFTVVQEVQSQTTYGSNVFQMPDK